MRRHAFSLVELSIVLVILGLLTGGILAGQSLIRSSELRSVTTEYTRYLTAAHAFRDKYFALPGDFSNGVRFWNRMVNNTYCVTNSSATIDATNGVCDGDADGNVSIPGAASRPSESSMFWRELAQTGYIEGVYSGYAGANTNKQCVVGTDCPSSRLRNGGWSLRFYEPLEDTTTAYLLTYGNTFIFGAQQANAGPAGALLKPEEAWNIDLKLDDGKPAYGKVIARFDNDACARPDDGTTFTSTNFVASYKLSDSSAQCALFIRQVF